MYIFRKATFNDKDRILEISKDVWEGNDYIHQVVDKWIVEESGEFTVLEVDGEVRAFAKFTFLSEGECWLEGIRVDSNYRNLGYANAMTEYYIEKAKSEKVKILRFSTYFQNYGSIRSAEKQGFDKETLFTYVELEQDALTDGPSTGSKLKDHNLAWKLVSQSQEFKLNQGLYSEGWRFFQLTPELLKELCEKGRVLIDVETESIVIFKPIDNCPPNVGFYCGEKEGVKSLLNGLFSEHPKGHSELMLIPGSELNGAFYELGFTLWEESIELNVFLYRYPL